MPFIVVVTCRKLVLSLLGGGILGRIEISGFDLAEFGGEIADERLRYIFQQTTTPLG